MALHRVTVSAFTVAFAVAILLMPTNAILGSGSGIVSVQTSAAVAPIFPPPSEMNETAYGALAQDLVTAIGLSGINNALTHFNGQSFYDCCLFDWGNRSVPLQNDTTWIVFTLTNQSLYLTYTSTGTLARIAVHGQVGPPLADTSPTTMRNRLDFLATQIGIGSVPSAYTSWTDVEPFALNRTTRFVNTTNLVRYSNYSGSPVAFGNEIQMAVDRDDALVLGLTIYPWFTAPPSPAISRQDAFSRALNYLNQTPMEGSPQYRTGSVFFAFDSVHYSVVYQVDAIYASQTNASGASQEWDVWVDPFIGSVTYAVRLLPPGLTAGGPPDVGSVVPFLLLAALVAACILLVVGFVAYSEPFWFGLFAIFIPLYFRLAKNTALDHFVRGQLYAQIVSHPGISFSELREAFDLQNGSVTYHIAVLEALGFIRTTTDGRRKRMYASTARGKVLGRHLSETQYKILEAVRQLGSAGPTEVAHALGMSKQRAAYNLKRLGEFGMLVPDSRTRGKFYVVAGDSNGAEEIDSLPQT